MEKRGEAGARTLLFLALDNLWSPLGSLGERQTGNRFPSRGGMLTGTSCGGQALEDSCPSEKETERVLGMIVYKRQAESAGPWETEAEASEAQSLPTLES